MIQEAKFQIGKSGITEGILDSLVLAFKNHKRVRVSLLKSSRSSDSPARMVEELSSRLAEKTGLIYSCKVIGFKIILTRHSK